MLIKKGVVDMKRLGVLLILVQFTLIGLFAGETNAAQYRHPATGLEFPDTIAGMMKGNVTDFEKKHPGLGVSIGYNGPGITVTIYLYNLGLKSISNDVAAPIQQKHFNEAVQEVYWAGKKGYYRSLKELGKGTTFLGSNHVGPKALFASFNYIQNGIERLSKLYLTGYENHFLKIRFTYNKVVRTQAEETQTRFLGEIGKMLEQASQ